MRAGTLGAASPRGWGSSTYPHRSTRGVPVNTRREGEASNMNARRKILVTAIRATGLVIPTNAAERALAYIRTETERGMLADEIERFRAELNAISAGFEVHPAETVMTAVYGLWANLDAVGEARSNPRIREFKARTAYYAGTLSSTLGDPQNGARWFDIGHGHANLSEVPGVKSIGHSREAIAGIYWGWRVNRVIADAELALKNAHKAEECGLAMMAWARAMSEARRDKSRVVKAVESAIGYAAQNPGEAPRPEAWWTHQAQMMAALALSRYGGMMGAVHEYINQAVNALPYSAVLLRTHAHLTLADAYAADRQYGEATDVTLRTLKKVPREHRQPVLLSRAYALHDRMRKRIGESYPVTTLRTGLRDLQGPNQV